MNVLYIDSVALGALFSVFATLVMVATVILTVSAGLLAIYAGCFLARLYM